MGHTGTEKLHAVRGAVHPHIRGAYLHESPVADHVSGSSPHTWGIRNSLPRSSSSSSVHPHIRGAYPLSFLLFRCQTGSSPHTWGILLQGRLVAQPERFIPTYVGHTKFLPAGEKRNAVHPHIRGAYGRSDRVPAGPGRFIPTYVGHTAATAGISKALSVHPHIRGAYGHEGPFSLRNDGSSPHTWGIRPPCTSRTPRLRFIPTYVGHTQRVWTSWAGWQVHPHIRGAYCPCNGCKKRQNGSSPHTWGIRGQGDRSRTGVRFIPTYVGHTSRPPHGIMWMPVHPHIRGAYGCWHT